MSITFKLIGVSEEKCPDFKSDIISVNKFMISSDSIDKEIDLSEFKKINYEMCVQYFKKISEKSLVDDDFPNIKLISGTESMNSESNRSKFYEVSSERIIFVFVTDENLKNKIVSLFNKFGSKSVKASDENKSETKKQSVDPKICQPLEDEQIEIDNNIIEESNKKTIELFNDSDFKSLIRIYRSNPNIFRSFASYISNGDAIIESFDESISKDNNYEDEFNQIKKLGLDIDDNSIRSSLKINNGHLNLTLRYLLYNDSQSESTTSSN